MAEISRQEHTKNENNPIQISVLNTNTPVKIHKFDMKYSDTIEMLIKHLSTFVKNILILIQK